MTQRTHPGICRHCSRGQIVPVMLYDKGLCHYCCHDKKIRAMHPSRRGHKRRVPCRNCGQPVMERLGDQCIDCGVKEIHAMFPGIRMMNHPDTGEALIPEPRARDYERRGPGRCEHDKRDGECAICEKAAREAMGLVADVEVEEECAA